MPSTELELGLIRKLATLEGRNPGDIRAFLQPIAEEARRSVGGIGSGIYVVEPPAAPNGVPSVRLMAGTGPFENPACELSYLLEASRNESGRLGLVGWVISKARKLVTQSPEETRAHAEFRGEVIGHDSLVGACAVLPIHTEGRFVGAIRVDTSSGGKLTPDHLVQLEQLTDIAARGMAHFEALVDGAHEGRVLAWAISVISGSASSEADVDSFLDLVVNVVAAATVADSCAIFLIDDAGRTLTQRAGCGSQAIKDGIRSYQIPNQELLESTSEPVGLTAYIAATGESFYARDFDALRAHKHHRGAYDGRNFAKGSFCGAWYGVPLKIAGQIIGVLKIENVSSGPDAREFSTRIRGRVDALADVVAVAQERVNRSVKSRFKGITEVLQTMQEIGASGLDVRAVVERVIKATQEQLGAKACALFLKEGSQLIQPSWAATGWAERGPKVRRYELVPASRIAEHPADRSERVGLTVWIAAMRRKFTAKSNDELKSHPHHLGSYDAVNFKTGQVCETFMGVPLIAGNDLIGVLKAETKALQTENGEEIVYFTEGDELVLELLASSAAVAIRNARFDDSKVLSSKLIACEAVDVFLHLHDHMDERVEVVDMLWETAEHVSSRSEQKHQVIKAVYEVIATPNLRGDYLEHLARLLPPDQAAPLRVYRVALAARTPDEILEFLGRDLFAELVQPSHAVLRPSAGEFKAVCADLASKLGGYRMNAANRDALSAGRRILEEASAAIETINLFDSTILRDIYGKWIAGLAAAQSVFHRLDNHYVAGLPLRRGSQVFYGRADVYEWLVDKLRRESGRLMVLRGGGRMGKTSLLNQLVAEGRGPLPDNVLPVLLDLHRLKTTAPGDRTGNLLLSIAEIVRSALRDRLPGCPEPLVRKFLGEAARPYTAFDEFIADLRKALGEDRTALIILDEFGTLSREVCEGRLDPDIFEYLRSVFQHSHPLAFLLAGKEHLEDLQPQFRNLILPLGESCEVGFLSAESSRQLILEPMRSQGVVFQEPVVERILRITRGHPYFIQQLCSYCVERLNELKRSYVVDSPCLEHALSMAVNTVHDNVLVEQLGTAGRAGTIVLRELAHLADEDNPFVPVRKLQDCLFAFDSDLLSQVGEFLKAHYLLIFRQSEDGERQVALGTDLLRRFLIAHPQHARC